MEFFKKFKTKAEYENYMASIDRMLPNVCHIVEPTGMKYNKYVETYNSYVLLTAESHQELSIYNAEGNAPSLRYSYDNKEWFQWDYSPIPFGDVDKLSLYIVGFNPEGVSKSATKGSAFAFSNADVPVDVEGNIMSLVNPRKNLLSIPTPYCFAYLFTSTPVRKVSENFLPATVLSPYCYHDLFVSCDYLEKAPFLPAENLVEGCYDSIFMGCGILDEVYCDAISISANNCTHNWLFAVAMSGVLHNKPNVPWKTDDDDGVPSYWFYYSPTSNYISFTANSPQAVDPPEYIYNTEYSYDAAYWSTIVFQSAEFGISGKETVYFRGKNNKTNGRRFTFSNDDSKVTVGGNALAFVDWENPDLDEVPEEALVNLFAKGKAIESVNNDFLHATTLNKNCYAAMFSGCTALTKAPNLPATTLTEGCYKEMFDSCTSLNEIHCDATDISATDCTKNWTNNVASQGVFFGDADTPWEINSPNGIPTGWTDINDALVVYMTASAPQTITAPAGTVFQYSYDCRNWSSMTSTVEFGTAKKETLYLRGDNLEGINAAFAFGNTTSMIDMGGNAMALLDYTAERPAVPHNAFANLFKGAKAIRTVSRNFLPSQRIGVNCYGSMFMGCTNLINTPDLPASPVFVSAYTYMFANCTSLVTAPELSSTDLSSSCYEGMFAGCTALTSAPELPATSIYTNSYRNMFSNCKSLVTAPELPSSGDEGLMPYCYYGMFKGCTSLKTAPELPAIAAMEGCYASMFGDCVSLEVAPELPAEYLEKNCYQDMFNGCRNLKTAPSILPASALSENCYMDMFYNCNKLEKAPTLPAPVLAAGCYNSMFAICTKINEIHCNARDISASGCTTGWLTGVASAGTFYGISTTPWVLNSPNGVPRGWNFVKRECVSMTALEAQTVTAPVGKSFEYSYNGSDWSAMTAAVEFGTTYKTVSIRGKNADGINGTFIFGNETALVDIEGDAMSLLDWETLPNEMPENGFAKLFENAKAIRSVSKSFLPATKLGLNCYQNMFNECSALINAPDLPSTELARSCYMRMFGGCGSLVTPPELPSTTLAYECYKWMFLSCGSMKTAPYLPATRLASSCYFAMFCACGQIKEIHCEAESVGYYYDFFVYDWLNGVSETGDFYGKASAGWLDGKDGIPTGWTKHLE